MLILSFCPKVHSETCTGANENCENLDPDQGDNLCCVWKWPETGKVLGSKFWIKERGFKKDGYYQACGSMSNFQYQTKSAYEARKTREEGLDTNIIIECKESSKQKLPTELEPCRKTTDYYSTAPSKDSCGSKTVDGGKGDSMCCYWKPTGKSNTAGFLDKDECAAINDDQFCNLDYYVKRKKVQYGLENLEIVCPDQKKGKDEYCSKNFCFSSTEVGQDGAEYCRNRPIHSQKQADSGDKYCTMWNPDKETTGNPDYQWLSGKTKCAGISEAQHSDISAYVTKKREELKMQNLKIIYGGDVDTCEKIDPSICKYSRNEGTDLCCKWTIPKNTKSTKDFSVLKDGETKGDNKQQCKKMSQNDYQQRVTVNQNLKKEYGLNNDVTMDCESGGTNEFKETKDDGPGYYIKKTSAQSLKISLLIMLSLIYLLF